MTLISITVGALGGIGVEELKSGKPHRRVVLCGSIVGGEWVDTNVSEDLPEVQAAASTAWTTEVVAAYRAIVEANYVPPVDPVPVQVRPYLLAMGQIKTDGTDVVSVAISASLAGAFLFGAGEIWCFFLEPQPDENYIVLAYDSNSVRAYVNDEDKFTDYFIIRTTDFSDPPVPTNPLSLNFEVKRVD